MLVWLQKMSQLPHFGHNKSFLKTKKQTNKQNKKTNFFLADEQC